MRILYDGMIFALQPNGGISRYFKEIIDGLPGSVAPTLTSVLRGHTNQPNHANLKVKTFPRFRPGRFSYPVERLYFQPSSRHTDILHPTYYLLLQGDRGLSKLKAKFVVSVYDMTHERYPELIDSDGEMAARKGWIINLADAILCISENTKKDLLHFYPHLDPERIFVTPLASRIETFLEAGDDAAPPARPYLLYVGSRISYKNFRSLAASFARVCRDHPDLDLYTVGGGAYDAEELQLFDDLKIKDRLVPFVHPKDGQLAKLYRQAAYFVYPSLYEGFGLPPLEALSCGAPTIVSNSSSLPEVVGDAGLYFEPADPESLTTVLAHALAHPEERAGLIDKGFRQAASFRWENTVRDKVRAYEWVLGQA